MQFMSFEDTRVEVNKLAWRNGLSWRPKKPGKPKTPKVSNEQPQKCDSVDTTLTNYKKNVQPEMKRVQIVRKLDILPMCAEVGIAT